MTRNDKTPVRAAPQLSALATRLPSTGKAGLRAFFLTSRITQCDAGTRGGRPGSHVLPRPGELNRSRPALP